MKHREFRKELIRKLIDMYHFRRPKFYNSENHKLGGAGTQVQCLLCRILYDKKRMITRKCTQCSNKWDQIVGCCADCLNHECHTELIDIHLEKMKELERKRITTTL